MKTAIVYDSTDTQAAEVYKALVPVCGQKGMILEMIDVSRDQLKPCIGCFGCWTKTPGICIHTKDAGASYLSKLFDADYMVFISKITWGGYSVNMKYYADRLLPLLHPCFVKRNGEMHHRLRYGKMPELLAVGFSGRTKEEETTFVRYTNAHRDNMGKLSDNGTFIWNEGIGSGRTAEKCSAWFSKEISK